MSTFEPRDFVADQIREQEMKAAQGKKQQKYGIQKDYIIEEEAIWTDKKRPFFGLPLSFTKYEMFDDRVSRESGIFSLHQEEIRIYRVVDAQLKQSVFQLAFHVGDIRLFSSDVNQPSFILRSVKNPKAVIRLIMNHAEEQRKTLGYGIVEL